MSRKSKRHDEPWALRPGHLHAIRFFTVAAMGLSAYLAWVSLSGGTAVGCGPDSGCDKVLQSRWAYWFRAPVSLFALAVYSLILGASFRPGTTTPPVVHRKAWAWLVSCAMAIVGAAIWFVGLQVFAVKAICPFCMAAHACGFIAAVLVLIGAPWRRAPAKPWESEKQVYVTPRAARRAGFAAGLALTALVSGQIVQPHRTSVVTPVSAITNAPASFPPRAHAPATNAAPATVQASTPASPVTNPPTQPPLPTPAPAAPVRAQRMFPVYGGRFLLDLHDVPTLGEPTNEQVVVSLFDYTCHHCRAMHPLLAEAQQLFSNRLVIASLPMPLDPACNPTVQRAHPLHTNACDYAKLGLAVWRADRARHHEFDDWLMTGEKPPPLVEARQHAAQLVGAEALDRAMQEPWIEQQLKINVALYEMAYRAGQGSMPQLIVGPSVALGTYLKPDLIKMLAENLGLPMPAP
jgi:uncharacterized membrane protein/protein-disulfide isomerase